MWLVFLEEDTSIHRDIKSFTTFNIEAIVMGYVSKPTDLENYGKPSISLLEDMTNRWAKFSIKAYY